MSHGCMKIMKRDVVIEKKFYYNNKERTKLFDEFFDYIRVRNCGLFIQVFPYTTEKIDISEKPSTNETNNNNMRKLEKWQEDLIKENLWELKSAELAKQAGVSRVTIDAKKRAEIGKRRIPSFIPDPPKKPLQRPPAVYSNKRYL